MKKEEIIKECRNLVKYKKKFDNKSSKLIKLFPESDISLYPSKNIDGDVFIYHNEFYQPTTIIIEKGNAIIECEKWSLFCWSSSSLNKISLNQFEYFKKINEDDVKTICEDMKKKHIEGIKKLEEDTLNKIKKTKPKQNLKENGN